MTRTAPALWLSLLGLLSAACTPAPTQPPPDDTPPPPELTGPVKVSYTLVSAEAQQLTLSPAGQLLTWQHPSGAFFQLEAPAGAVLEETPLTLTPLADIQVDGSEAAIQLGVQLEPHGLTFHAPVTLRMIPAQGTGEGVHLTWVDPADDLYAPITGPVGATGRAEGPTQHFSVYLGSRANLSRLKRSIQHAAKKLTETKALRWVEALLSLRAEADRVEAGELVSAVDTALSEDAAAAADAITAGAGVATPEEVIRLASTGFSFAETGLSELSGAYATAARTRYLGYHLALQTRLRGEGASWALLPSINEALALTSGFVPLGVSSAEALAAEFALDLQAAADARCDAGDFSGKDDLLRLAAEITSWNIEAPTAAALTASADTCRPPRIDAHYLSGAMAHTRLVMGPTTLSDVQPQLALDPIERDALGWVTGGGLRLDPNAQSPEAFTGLLVDNNDSAKMETRLWGAPGEDRFTFTLSGETVARTDPDPLVRVESIAEVKQNTVYLQVENPRITRFTLDLDWNVLHEEVQQGNYYVVVYYSVRSPFGVVVPRQQLFTTAAADRETIGTKQIWVGYPQAQVELEVIAYLQSASGMYLNNTEHRLGHGLLSAEINASVSHYTGP